ncbi:MAG: hypothetical protein QXP49_02445 [Nitrososphaerota archaeon]
MLVKGTIHERAIDVAYASDKPEGSSRVHYFPFSFAVFFSSISAGDDKDDLFRELGRMVREAVIAREQFRNALDLLCACFSMGEDPIAYEAVADLKNELLQHGILTNDQLCVTRIKEDVIISLKRRVLESRNTEDGSVQKSILSRLIDLEEQIERQNDDLKLLSYVKLIRQAAEEFVNAVSVYLARRNNILIQMMPKAVASTNKLMQHLSASMEIDFLPDPYDVNSDMYVDIIKTVYYFMPPYFGDEISDLDIGRMYVNYVSQWLDSPSRVHQYGAPFEFQFAAVSDNDGDEMSVLEILPANDHVDEDEEICKLIDAYIPQELNRRVCKMMVGGYSDSEISRKLGISMPKVKKIRRELQIAFAILRRKQSS